MKDYHDYFENRTGIGVLATSDDKGNVDIAIYARPHCMDDGSIAFIMSDRLSHSNINKNPHAAYLFMENGSYKDGLRLYLTKVREETDENTISQLRRKKAQNAEHYPRNEKKFLVYFSVDRALPLVGDA
jgi:hypothetical protein